jgi:hypothetical protein
MMRRNSSLAGSFVIMSLKVKSVSTQQLNRFSCWAFAFGSLAPSCKDQVKQAIIKT